MARMRQGPKAPEFRERSGRAIERKGSDKRILKHRTRAKPLDPFIQGLLAFPLRTLRRPEGRGHRPGAGGGKRRFDPGACTWGPVGLSKMGIQVISRARTLP